MKRKSKIIGLIGGMGPFASAYFYKLLVKKSSDKYGAKNNDEYPEVVLDSIPVPDFISNTKNLSEAKNLLSDRIRRMNSYGITDLAMVCNTGHILFEHLSNISNSNFYSMIDLVSDEVGKRGYKRVGILATNTTIKYNLYGKEFEKIGVKYFYPNKKMQELHEVIIRDLIAGENTKKYRKRLTESAHTFMSERKLDGIILGCTELPLIFPKSIFSNNIDCMEVLADKLLERYYN